MAEPSHYDVGDGDLHVLKNKLGITDLVILQDAETILLADAYQYFFQKLYRDEIIFNVSLLFAIHKYFLETLYEWAGKVRKVEMSKSGVLFAPSIHIMSCLNGFERVLQDKLPQNDDTKEEAAMKLAELHCELNAIHPFREGNGRSIRLFLDLLAVNAGFELIDFAAVSKDIYIDACIHGMKKDYEPMERILLGVLVKVI